MNTLIDLPVWAQIVILAVLFVVGIVFHEQGHYKALLQYCSDAKRPYLKRQGWRFSYGVSWPEGVLSVEQRREVYFIGIMTGIAPLVLSLWLVQAEYFFVLVGVYFVGCWSDFLALWRLR